MTDNIITIFPTTILESDILRDITKEELGFINSLELKENIGNKNTVNSYVLDSKELSEIKKWFEFKLNFLTKNILSYPDNLNLYITQSWINYTKTGEYHNPHIHSNSLYSGVFYFQTEETDVIKFETSSPFFNIERKEYNLYNANAWLLPVKTGKLLMFPSNLEHSVPITKSKNTRISLSFNTFIRGEIGTKHNFNFLNLK
jgi:uncharacterized protein (TIGR02466 family)